MDREAKLREITAEARRQRDRPSRALWIWALVLAVVCVGSLAIAWVRERDTKAAPRPEHASEPRHGLGSIEILAAGFVLVVVVRIVSQRR